MATLYLGLVHHPVYNKNGDKIASALTTLDLHDLARLCKTYGLKRYFVITPLEDQRELAERVIRHWTKGYGARYNRDRKEAVQEVCVVPDLDRALGDIEKVEGERPLTMATDAAPQENALDYTAARGVLARDRAVLLLLGTAWGLHQDVLRGVDFVLEPVTGAGEYNHLSVRTAAAVIVDRLLGAGR